MKNIVFNDTGREVEFKPDLIIKKYLTMNEKDIKKEFKDKKNLTISNCPGCKSIKNKKAFDKFGFQYVECQDCGTVYMCPHPNDEKIKQHFLKSSSIHYWRDTLSKATVDKRKEKIYYPRMQWIIDIAEEYSLKEKNIADFNSKNVDYITYLLNYKYFDNKIVINPYFNIEEISDEVIKNNLLHSSKKKYTTSNSINIATAFEVVDHISDVDTFMKTIKDMLCKGGLCFMTTISISGFDMQVLWENSRSIFPLDRINVFSYKGLKLLAQRHGFEMIEYSTPGVLDFDIVENELKKHPEIECPRFIKTMVEREDEQLKQDFQTFLQVNRLSSFVRIVLKKV